MVSATPTRCLVLFFNVSLSCLQVVCPRLPVGQLDGAVGESRADWCHLSLLAVSLRHSGPQQLSRTKTPRG